ncbi:hypothetical protein ID866_11953 [Astraeus odoratus]|nr:hypothetical protein ID866_11953 [Astraeus odoratus]
MCKSSTVTGALAEKSTDWTKVPDEELVTNLDDMDLAEEVERHWKEEEERWQQEAEAEQKWEAKKANCCCSGQKAAAGQFRGSGKQKPGECILGVKKRLACRWCTKAKEWCEWLEVEMLVSRAGTSPQGREHRKWVKKVADNNDDDEIVILSGQKTKWQGGSETLEEITNSHLEKIVSMAQSNRQKMQCHYMLMEGLVGQQQVLLSKLVEIASAAGSGGSKEVIEDQEELKEAQREESEGQEGDTEGVPGEVPEGELEDVLGNELEDGAGVEDGAGEEAQKKDKGKGKEKAL